MPLLISISTLKLNLQNVFGAIAAYSYTILDFDVNVHAEVENLKSKIR
ncbi:MAG: hypothetical protein V7K15_07250 [Nostoc sp.]